MVAVVDPMHPLYGRRFTSLHHSSALTGLDFVWVGYWDFMQLRIPLAASNLVPACLHVRTLLTEQAITSDRPCWPCSRRVPDVFPHTIFTTTRESPPSTAKCQLVALTWRGVTYRGKVNHTWILCDRWWEIEAQSHRTYYRLMTADVQLFDLYSENVSYGLRMLHMIHDCAHGAELAR
jgi:hypothetical protein